MKKANEMVVVPTAELLSEMEALEIIGGVAELNDTNVFALAKCEKNESNCYTYCAGGNCVPQCNCTPTIVVPDPGPGTYLKCEVDPGN